MSDLNSLLYFGKVPGRGDFVRSTAHPALIQSLDRWLSSGIELMAEDAHWKGIYDQADAAHFVMISAHRHTAVAGHIVPSVDLSGRRFPLLTATAIEDQRGPDLMAIGPLMLQPAWLALAEAAARARRASEEQVPAVLTAFAQARVPALQTPDEARQRYRDFLESSTLGGLQQDIGAAGGAIDLRQILLALGLLLQPVMNSGGQTIEKGLCLPLPRDESARFVVAAFWMDVVSRFLLRSTHDLTLFMPRGVNHRPSLMIAFSAGAANVLQGLLDPRVTPEVFISLDASPWVEDYVSNDYALKKLSTYLLTPQLSLAQLLTSFQEAFLGS